MKVRARYNHWLPKALGVYAITLFPWVLFDCDIKEAQETTLMGHECIHVRQIRSVGVLYFYWSYWWDYLCDRVKGLSHEQAYERNYYEAEAYAGEHDIEMTEDELREFGVFE